MNIAFIIREYLLRNDQLVIPGFGTFRVIHQPARINTNTKHLLPPSKNIVFESQQKSDDNQFILSVKKRLGLSESGTDQAIKNFLNQIEEDIRVRKKAVIEGVGQFSADKAGKLIFEPQGDLLNLTGEFALPKIEMPASARPEKVPIPVAKNPEPLKPVVRRRKKWRIPVTILVIFIVLAAVSYFTGIFDRFPVSRQTKEPVKSEGQTVNRMVFGSRKPSEKDSLQDSIRRQLEKQTARENALRFEEENQKKPAEPVLPVTTPDLAVRHAGPYHIISGAFLVSGNAEKQLTVLRAKGLDPQLLPRKGKYYMVSLGSFATKHEAASAMNKLHETLEQELWVMKLSRE